MNIIHHGDLGIEFADGMVMTLATLEEITESRSDEPGFVRIRVRGELLAKLRPHGLAPVFKIFTARSPGTPITLPNFDDDRLAVPSWESDPTRPIARAYTALGYSPGDDAIEFEALRDLGPDSWVRRARAGDTVGIIGFKHGLTVPSDIRRLILAGDRSAVPAMSEIARHAPAGVTVAAIRLDEVDDAEAALHSQLSPAVPAVPREGTVPTAGTDDTVLTTDIEGTVPAEGSEGADDTAVFLAGEAGVLTRLREVATAAGVGPEKLTILPYWHRGLSREDYDRALYRRYQQATAAGETISDPQVAWRIELAEVTPGELDAASQTSSPSR